MYPKNAASPEPIAIGPVILIADGTVQTSGCTVRIKPIGVAEGDGGGTTAYSTDGIVLYTPTQAETNYTSFVLIAKKASCIPASITVVTTDSATPGTVKLAPVTHTSAVVPTVSVLTGHTPQTGDSYAIVNSGTHGNASLKTLIDAVDNFVDTEIGAIITTLGTPAGASISADLLVIDNLVDDLEGRLTSARAGYLDNLQDGPVALDSTVAKAEKLQRYFSIVARNDLAVTADLATERGEINADYGSGGGVFSSARDSLEQLRDSIDTIDDFLDTEIAAILADTNELQTDWADGGRLDAILDARASQTSVNTIDGFLDTEIAAILAAVDTEIGTLQTSVSTLWTTQLTEAYRADGAAPTPAQGICELLAHHGEVAISGTTKRINQFDGSTQAAAYTLDSSSTPTTITRSA